MSLEKMDRTTAYNLVKEYTANQNLIKHMLAVESAMRAYAKRFNEDEQKWAVTGLVHDFDYEKMGSEHPSEWGFDILRENGADEQIIQAVIGHGLRDEPESRPTKMAKALFAVDELTGFIVACALPRPNQISDLEVSSIKKKFKDKAFAKGVHREHIFQGAQELGIDIDEHIQIVLDSMKEIKEELGLR